MNKIIAIFIMVLFPILSYAQFKGKVSTGYDIKSNHQYTILKIKYEFKYKNLKISPYTMQKCWFDKNDMLSFKPFRHVYKIGLKADYRKVFVKIFHYCSHEVVNENRCPMSTGVYTWMNKDYYKWMDESSIGKSTCIEVGIKF